jgi:hypothetical protein
VFWARLLAYVTATANQELLLRSEYLAAENRMLRGQIRVGCCFQMEKSELSYGAPAPPHKFRLFTLQITV